MTWRTESPSIASMAQRSIQLACCWWRRKLGRGRESSREDRQRAAHLTAITSEPSIAGPAIRLSKRSFTYNKGGGARCDLC